MTRLSFVLAIVTTSLSGCAAGMTTVRGPYDAHNARYMSEMVPAGMPVSLVVPNRITSRTPADAATAQVTVQADVVVNGTVAIRAGTPVEAVISRMPSAGGGSPGLVRIQPVGVPDVNGSWVSLSAPAVERVGRSRTGKAVGLGIGLMPFLGPFAWFFFGINGREAVVERGAVFVAQVHGPQVLVQPRGPPTGRRCAPRADSALVIAA